MTCDELHRVVIPEAIAGRQYRVNGLTLEMVPEAEKVVVAKLVRKGGVLCLDAGMDVPGEAIVEAIRQHREGAV